MEDMYDSFAALSASESEYRIIYEEKNGSELIVLGPHGAELSLASVNWCGHFRIDVPSICLRV
nr:hypothetical protein [Lactobacillus paragasseri]